jgi:tripartite-type tricarboxylate transporter receptor subunit TctC
MELDMRGHPYLFLLAMAVLFGSSLTAPAVSAQDYPTRPITLIVPWPAGGSVDGLSRALAPELARRLGTPVVIENRPGVGSTLGTAAVAKAAPDGYTLAMGGSASLAVAVTAHKRLPYHPTTDFAPVALIARIPFVLVVHPSLQVSTVTDLVRLAKDKPGRLFYGSGGPGSPHHLCAELLKSMTGIEMTHVPYKGSAPALTDVVGGHISLMFSDPVPALPQIKAGNLRALGVSSITRWPPAPEIPTIAEAGVPGFDAVGWVVVVAPANTPREIVMRLHTELRTIVSVPEIEDRLMKLGIVPVASPPPAELQHFLSSEIERWATVVRQAGLAGME